MPPLYLNWRYHNTNHDCFDHIVSYFLFTRMSIGPCTYAMHEYHLYPIQGQGREASIPFNYWLTKDATISFAPHYWKGMKASTFRAVAALTLIFFHMRLCCNYFSIVRRLAMISVRQPTTDPPCRIRYKPTGFYKSMIARSSWKEYDLFINFQAVHTTAKHAVIASNTDSYRLNPKGSKFDWSHTFLLYPKLMSGGFGGGTSWAKIVALLGVPLRESWTLALSKWHPHCLAVVICWLNGVHQHKLESF